MLPEIESLARRLAGFDADAEVLELARRVSEAQVDLNRVRAIRRRLIISRRKRADQILALDPGGGYSPREARGNCQTALADRARLSGTQAGTGPRSRGWRGFHTPPHGALRRSLRIPG